MSVLVILGRKCSLVASRAALQWVTLSMRRRDRQTDMWTDGGQTVALCFPLNAGSVIIECNQWRKFGGNSGVRRIESKRLGSGRGVGHIKGVTPPHTFTGLLPRKKWIFTWNGMFWWTLNPGALVRSCRCRCKNFHRSAYSLLFVCTDGNQVS